MPHSNTPQSPQTPDSNANSHPTSHSTPTQTPSLTQALAEMEYAKDWTKQTREWYRHRLTPFITYGTQAGIKQVGEVTAPLVRRWLDELRTTPSSGGKTAGQLRGSHTVHGYARAVRALLNFAAAEDWLDERVAKRIALPVREQKVLQILSDDQLKRLFAAAKTSDHPLRDTALLSLLVDTGLRATELVSLTLDDVTLTPDSAWLVVRRGKGRKGRQTGMGKKARMALHRYLTRERHAKDPDERHVFLARTGKPLSVDGLDRLLYRLRDTAGKEWFEGVSVGAHRFRHLYAVRSLEAGVDLYTLSAAMGHSSLQVTSGYLKAVSQRALREMSVSPLDSMGNMGSMSGK